MNTETLNALKQLAQAKATVLSALNDDTLPITEKEILDGVLLNLQDQENTLINYTLQDMTDRINASNIALQALIQQMNSASQQIAGINSAIKKVSNVLSTLAEITSKALAAGLLG